MKKMILASSLVLFSSVPAHTHPLIEMNDRFGNQIKDSISFSCRNQIGLGGQYLSLTKENNGYLVEIQDLDTYQITYKELVELQPTTADKELKNTNLLFSNKTKTNIKITFDIQSKKNLVTLTTPAFKFNSDNCLANVEVKIASVLSSDAKATKESNAKKLESILKISDPHEMLQFFSWIDYAESKYHSLISHQDLSKLFIETYTALIKDDSNKSTRLYHEFIGLAVRSSMSDEQLIKTLKQVKKLNPEALDYLAIDLKEYSLKERNVEAILKALQ